MTILLFSAVLLRLAFLPFFEGGAHDGTHRTLVAWSWLQDPYLIVGQTVWPVLNYLFPAFAILITGEMFWSTSILYLLISVSNIWAIYLLAREALGERSAWVSAVLITINPYHIRCSIDGAMSETPYVTLVLLALYFAFRYRQSKRWRYLFSCGVAVNLATMFRFDAILWGAISGYIIFIPEGKFFPRVLNPRAWGSLIALGAICAIFPLLLTIRWHQLYGDILYYFHTVQGSVDQFTEGGKHPRFPLVYQTYTIVFWPASSFLILTPLVAATSLIGMLGCLFRREQVGLAVGYTLFSVFLMSLAYNHNILCAFRYSLILQILLSAFFLIGVKQLLRWFHWLSPRIIYVGCCVLGIITYAVIVSATLTDAGVVTRQFSAISPVSANPYATRGALKWIRKNTLPGEKVLVTPGGQSPYFSLNVRDLIDAGRVVTMSIYKDSMRVYSIDELVEVFKTMANKSDYVLLNQKVEFGLSDGMVRGILSVPPDPTEVFEQFGFRYLPAADFGRVRIYKIERMQPNRTS